MKVIIACGVLVLAALLQVNGECRNRRADCSGMKLYCGLKPYEPFMRQWCPKLCGFCGPTIPTNPPTWPPHTEPPTLGPSATHPPLGECGKPQIMNPRVIAGTTARRGAWPWQILMLYNGRAGCGGSIVSPTWIVTAAHCVSGKESRASAFKIRVGEHNRNSREGSEVEMPVKRVLSHPSWNRRTMNNDIAMIQLARPITFNTYVQPVCIPRGDVSPGAECYITGWGKTSHPGSMTSILQQAILPVVSNSVCHALNKNTLPIPITRSMICGGHGGSTRKSGCHGDSGGPYVCSVGGRWELHGAVSHGSPKCNSKETYTVFARVTNFQSWISRNMALYGI